MWGWYCDSCGEEFRTCAALEQHEIIHLPRDIECYGCYKTFRRYCDMISHLEQGVCSSGIDHEDINESAAMIYQWKHIMDEDFRDKMLRKRTKYSRGFQHEGRPWKCPYCGAWFKKLSSLFQHGWNNVCEDHHVMLKLRRWLASRHA